MDLLEEFGSFSEDVLTNHVNQLLTTGVCTDKSTLIAPDRHPVCDCDKGNIHQTHRLPKKSATKDLLIHCDETVLKGESGLAILCECVHVIGSFNPSVVHAMTADPQRESIESVPGENVELHDNSIETKMRMLEGSGHKPMDVAGLCLGTMHSATDLNLQITVQHEDKEACKDPHRDWCLPMRELFDTWRDSMSRGLCGPASMPNQQKTRSRHSRERLMH